ncbi:MAG: hypothetical protein ACT4NY_11330 [Pseudonocardiales bacterium]
MTTYVPPTELDPLPRLYALHKENEAGGPAIVAAWGLAFADGSALTLWCDEPYIGASTVANNSVQTVQEYIADRVGAYFVWLPDPALARPESQQ